MQTPPEHASLGSTTPLCVVSAGPRSYFNPDWQRDLCGTKKGGGPKGRVIGERLFGVPSQWPKPRVLCVRLAVTFNSWLSVSLVLHAECGVPHSIILLLQLGGTLEVAGVPL